MKSLLFENFACCHICVVFFQMTLSEKIYINIGVQLYSISTTPNTFLHLKASQGLPWWDGQSWPSSWYSPEYLKEWTWGVALMGLACVHICGAFPWFLINIGESSTVWAVPALDRWASRWSVFLSAFGFRFLSWVPALASLHSGLPRVRRN